MKTIAAAVSVCGSLLIFGACGKQFGPRETAAGCDLLKSDEVEAVQGSHIANITHSVASDDGLRITNCVFIAADSSKSASLTITASAPGVPKGKGATAAWEKIFSKFGKAASSSTHESRDGAEEHESRKESEKAGKEEVAEAPTKIDGIGDEAFWSANRMGGSLYVLKKSRDLFLRVNLGGPGDPEKKLSKSKVLAQKSLERL